MAFNIQGYQLVCHIGATNPSSAPSRLWWVYLFAMHSYTKYTASTFWYIQGSTTLVSEQTSAIKRIIATFIEDVGLCVGPLTPEAIVFLDPTTHVSSGLYSVSMHQVRDYPCGLARWVEEIIDEADTPLQQQLLHANGSVFTVARDRIHNVCVLCNRDNSPFIDELSLPPVVPKELVKTRPRDFLCMVCDHSFRLEHFFSNDNAVDLIADEHKALIMKYHTDELLRQAIDSSPDRSACGNSSFADAWNIVLLGTTTTINDGFRNLNAFCGGIATLFPGTCTVESDFSILRWEKDSFRKSLSDFGLEAVLQAKQFLTIQQLSLV